MDTERHLAATLGIPLEIKQISIGAFNINYMVAGKGPPLLLIHGANFGWGVWYPNIPAFAEHFTVYAIDLPGAGNSSVLDYEKLDPEDDFFRVTKGFIEYHGFRTLHVIGHSIGGWVALKLASINPERIERVVAVDPVGFFTNITMSDRVIMWYPLAKLISHVLLRPEKGGKNLEKSLRSAFHQRHTALRPEFISYFHAIVKKSPPLLLFSRLTKLRHRLFLENELKSIQNKTLLIWGERDTILPLASAAPRFDFLRNKNIEIFPNTGHAPFIEAPKRFNDLVLSFFSK